MSGLRIFCAVRLTPQENCPAIQRQPATAVIAKGADAETDLALVDDVIPILCRHTTVQDCRHLIEIAFGFIPQLHILPQGQISEPDFHCFLILLCLGSGFH